METVVNIALVVAITAFLREQFALSGTSIKWTALGVFAVVWGVPQIAALYPQISPLVMSLFQALEVFLGAMGTADFVSVAARKVGQEVNF